MQKNISYEMLLNFVDVLSALKKLDLMGDYLVTWERRPSMLINMDGYMEFEHPEEMYRCCITFWDDSLFSGSAIKVRFNVVDEE